MREIDLTKRLSDEDRKWLEDRDRWRDVAANVKEFGGEPAVMPKNLPQSGPESTINQLGPTALTPEQEADSRKAGEKAAGEGEPEEDQIPYRDMTVDQLKSELDGRKPLANSDEERANLNYGSKDNKDRLVERLEKDDELASANNPS